MVDLYRVEYAVARRPETLDHPLDAVLRQDRSRLYPAQRGRCDPELGYVAAHDLELLVRDQEPGVLLDVPEGVLIHNGQVLQLLLRLHQAAPSLAIGRECRPVDQGQHARIVQRARRAGAVIDQLRAVFREPEIVAGTWRAARAQDGEGTEAEVREALMQLDPLWDEFFPVEQARIVALLVERVEIGTERLNVRLGSTDSWDWPASSGRERLRDDTGPAVPLDPRSLPPPQGGRSQAGRVARPRILFCPPAAT